VTCRNVESFRSRRAGRTQEPSIEMLVAAGLATE